jgi:hypothetical protein
MYEPLIFISRHQASSDVLEEALELGRQFIEHVESVEPDALTLQMFLDDDTGELVYVHVHSSAAAADAHLQLTHEHIATALKLLHTTSITVYGAPGPVLTEALQHNSNAGVPVTVMTTRLGGFLRPIAAAA